MRKARSQDEPSHLAAFVPSVEHVPGAVAFIAAIQAIRGAAGSEAVQHRKLAVLFGAAFAVCREHKAGAAVALCFQPLMWTGLADHFACIATEDGGLIALALAVVAPAAVVAIVRTCCVAAVLAAETLIAFAATIDA